MAKFPIIRVTKSGRRYFILHGKKVYIKSKLTKKEIALIYKLLSKNRRRLTQGKSKISNVINIRNTAINRPEKPFPSFVQPPAQVMVRGSNARDQDLLNKLINDLNKKLPMGPSDKGEQKTDKGEQKSDKGEQKTDPESKTNPKSPQLMDLSLKERLELLNYDPVFQQLLSEEVNIDDPRYRQLAIKYGVEDAYNKKLAELRSYAEEEVKNIKRRYSSEYSQPTQ